MPEKKLLERAHSQLLMIDIQDKLLPAIANHVDLVKRNAILLQIASRLGLPQTVTIQNPNKLGPVPGELTQHYKAPVVMTKMAFSAMKEKTVEAHMKHSSRKQIILCGIESHICVLQTALDLVEKGFSVFVPFDAVGSRDVQHYEMALRRMESAGCNIVSVESALFELLVEAGTEEFRELRRLIL